VRSATITIPWDGSEMTFDRDRLETAVLLYMEHDGDLRAVRTELVYGHRLRGADAIHLAVAARICRESGIEP
jgi:hypothetical protein